MGQACIVDGKSQQGNNRSLNVNARTSTCSRTHHDEVDEQIHLQLTSYDHIPRRVTHTRFVSRGWGAGPGKFKGPTAAIVLPSGELVVCDMDNHRLQVLDIGMVKKKKWKEKVIRVIPSTALPQSANNNNNNANANNSIAAGKGPEEFDKPSAVLWLPHLQCVVVSDYNNDRLQFVDPYTGRFVREPITGLTRPVGLELLPCGRIIVCESHQVSVVDVVTPPCEYPAHTPSEEEEEVEEGDENDDADAHTGASTSGDGNDIDSQQRRTRTKKTKKKKQMHPAVRESFVLTLDATGETVSDFKPFDCCLLPHGRLALTEAKHHVISILDISRSGEWKSVKTIGRRGEAGTTEHSLGRPTGVVRLPNGNLMVGECDNHDICEVDPLSATVIRRIGKKGEEKGNYRHPVQVALTMTPMIALEQRLNRNSSVQSNNKSLSLSRSGSFAPIGAGRTTSSSNSLAASFAGGAAPTDTNSIALADDADAPENNPYCEVIALDFGNARLSFTDVLADWTPSGDLRTVLQHCCVPSTVLPLEMTELVAEYVPFHGQEKALVDHYSTVSQRIKVEQKQNNNNKIDDQDKQQDEATRSSALYSPTKLDQTVSTTNNNSDLTSQDTADTFFRPVLASIFPSAFHYRCSCCDRLTHGNRSVEMPPLTEEQRRVFAVGFRPSGNPRRRQVAASEGALPSAAPLAPSSTMGSFVGQDSGYYYTDDYNNSSIGGMGTRQSTILPSYLASDETETATNNNKNAAAADTDLQSLSSSHAAVVPASSSVAAAVGGGSTNNNNTGARSSHPLLMSQIHSTNESLYGLVSRNEKEVNNAAVAAANTTTTTKTTTMNLSSSSMPAASYINNNSSNSNSNSMSKAHNLSIMSEEGGGDDYGNNPDNNNAGGGDFLPLPKVTTGALTRDSAFKNLSFTEPIFHSDF